MVLKILLPALTIVTAWLGGLSTFYTDWSWYESLPAFLALALLSLVLGVDTSSAACVWLIARVGHLIFYVAGIGLLRTASWLISLGALVCMACALI